MSTLRLDSTERAPPTWLRPSWCSSVLAVALGLGTGGADSPDSCGPSLESTAASGSYAPNAVRARCEAEPGCSGCALARSTVEFLPWQLAHTAMIGLAAGFTNACLIVLGIGAQALVLASLIAMAADPNHRAAHDWIAGTRVMAPDHSTRPRAEGGST